MTTACRKRNEAGAAEAQNQTVVSDFCCLISELPLCMIFCKLSIKDVMRCKCVCTEWNSLISQPHFSQIYAKASPFTPIFQINDPNLSSHFSYLLEISDKNYRRVPFTPKLPDGFIKCCSKYFMDYCNGFLCVKVMKPGSEFVYVVNPVMGGDPIELPQLQKPDDDSPSDCIDLSLHKLGFVLSTNAYKVLRLSFVRSAVVTVEQCHILTLGVDHTWRPLPNFFTGLQYPFVKLLELNSAFHWIPTDVSVGGFISTFGLAEENFGQISMPPISFPIPKKVQLAIFGNQLGLVDCSDPSQIAIWRMKEYSVIESWTKVVVSRSCVPPTPYRDPAPIAQLRNGDILFSEFNSCLVSCNIEKKKCSKIKVYGVAVPDSHSTLTFTPNFTSSAEWIMKGRANTVNVQSE